MHKFVTYAEIIVCDCLGWGFGGRGQCPDTLFNKNTKDTNTKMEKCIQYRTGLSENRIIHRLNSYYYIYIFQETRIILIFQETRILTILLILSTSRICQRHASSQPTAPFSVYHPTHIQTNLALAYEGLKMFQKYLSI